MVKLFQQLLLTVTILVVLFYGTAIALSYGNPDQVAISKSLVCTADRGADSIFQILRNGNLLNVFAEKNLAAPPLPSAPFPASPPSNPDTSKCSDKNSSIPIVETHPA
jgi:hypothetical protein